MKINLRESLNKLDLATNNKYDLLNTFNSKKLSDNNKKKLAEAIENNSIASINKILHESNEKVFTVKVYQDYPFVAEVIDNSIIDKNGEGKVLKKFTNRDALDDFANELISKGYVNYQGYSKNKSLHESEEQLFKVVIQSGATKRDFESGLYEHEAEEIVDYYDGRWIDENGFEWDMYVEEDDDSIEHAMTDNSYDMEDDDERAQREMDAYDQSDRDWEYVESLNEASYGGAYDIEDDMFFTKEEIVEFVEEICEYLGDIFGYQYDINNVYMDGPRKLYINIYDNNYIEVESTFDIDMRRIRKPSDLSKVYGLTIKNWFQKAFAREYRDAGLDESLNKKNLKEDYDEDVKKVKELITDANSAFKVATNLIYFIDDDNSLSSLGYEALEMLKDANKTKYRELLRSISSDIDEEDLRDYGAKDSGILDLLYDSHLIQEYIDSALNYILASKNSKKNDYIKKLAFNIIDEVEEDELARFINDDLGDSFNVPLKNSKTSDSKSDDDIVYGIKVVFIEDTDDIKKGSWYIKGTGFKPIARDVTLIKDNQRFNHSYLKDKDFLKYYAYHTKKEAIKDAKNMSRYYQNGEDISVVEINLNDIDESLTEAKKVGNNKLSFILGLPKDDWKLVKITDGVVSSKGKSECRIYSKELDYNYDTYDYYQGEVIFDDYGINNPQLIQDTFPEEGTKVKLAIYRVPEEDPDHNWTGDYFVDYIDETNESLTEDTVKQNGKWVNKGSEGTHGKFRTKKAADAQRKAMFANGYKTESLDKQKYSSGNYFLTVDETGMGPHYSLYYQHPYSGYDGLMFIVDGYGYDNFKEKLSKFSTVYPNKDVQNLLKNINENKSNDESLSEKLIPAPQEVVDELLSILEKYDFVLDDSLRHPIGKTWSGNTHVQVINKDSYMEETDDPDIYFEELKEYVSDEMENEIDMLSDRSDCRITYNFGINKNWQVTGGLDVWEKHVPGLQDESLKEQVNLPGYAVKYTSGYAGNGVNSSKTEWFRTEEERDRRVKELKDKNYTEIKTWKMDNFYHTLPKNESLNEAYEYLYNQPFLKTFDEFVSKVSGLKADELDDEVWNEYFHEYQVYNEKYKVKDFENKLRKSLEEKDLEVISIEPNETATLVTVKFDGTEKKFRFKFRLFDVNDSTEEYYIYYIISMIAGYFGLNESLKEDYKKLFGYNILSSTLKDGGDTYALLRKTEDGKTKWAAAKYVNGIPDEDNIFEITYEQARGFEPLTDTGKVSKKLGKELLPKKESLKEDLSDLDLILNTPADTKQFNEETFRALKNLVSEYKKDLDSLDQWASESEKEPFVKKWYKLADKCQEIAKNGTRGITGYGRLKDAIKLKIVDLARSVDNTFPWYTKNRLEKFGELEESLTEDLDFFDIVDNIPLNVLNDDICQGDVFTGFYFNSEESANRFANYLERKGFTVDQSEDSSYVKGFNYKVSVFDNIEGKYFDDETYDESLDEAYGEDLSDIQEIKQLDFVNRRVNNLRGIFSVKDFVNALNNVGLDSFKIRTSRLKNISSGDLKDAWYSLKKNGWTMSISHDSSLDGFNEVYVFSKIKNESLKEAFDDEVDLDYESDFDEGNVEEGNVFTEGGVDYAWIEREAGPIYLDFDKWAVWSAREYVDPREFITLHDDSEGYDFDKDAFEKKAMAAPIVYFVVEEDTGFIDWGPEDNEIAAKDFLNSKKEDWENDMDESLNEDKELREYYAVNLHYEDIGDGREYDYKADYDDVLEYLMDYCVDEDDAPEDTQEYMEWVVNNFDYLFKKHEYDILEYFYEDASQEEYEERNRPYEPEYDPMSDEV